MIEETLLIGLTIWRLSSLLVEEEGPFDVFEKLRRFLGVPETGEVEGLVPKLFSCIWCMSVWVAPFVWLAWEFEPTIVIIGAAMAVALGAKRWLEPR